MTIVFFSKMINSATNIMKEPDPALFIALNRKECFIGLTFSFCGLLIIFANSLDLDQDRTNIGPDLDPNSLTLLVFQREFFKKSADDNSFVLFQLFSVLCLPLPAISALNQNNYKTENNTNGPELTFEGANGKYNQGSEIKLSPSQHLYCNDYTSISGQEGKG